MKIVLAPRDMASRIAFCSVFVPDSPYLATVTPPSCCRSSPVKQPGLYPHRPSAEA